MRRAFGLLARMAAIMIIFVCACLFVAHTLFTTLKQADGPHQQNHYFLVEPGANAEGLALALKQAGLIDKAWHYRAVHYWRQFSFTPEYMPKAGEYLIPAAASLETIAGILHKGVPAQRRITLPEGLTTAEILVRLDAAPGLKGVLPGDVAEGSLYPDTYFYSYGMSKAQMILRLQKKMEMELAEAWAERADNLPYETPQEALIMASIIEKETGLSGERGLVASVFVNRLQTGMRLQSDPTVIYGVGSSDVKNYIITKSDLQALNAYNTYKIDGLPPTPICNPGRASMQAALNPDKSAFLYFVADGKGGHNFAKTLDAHNKNVRAYRQSLRTKP